MFLYEPRPAKLEEDFQSGKQDCEIIHLSYTYQEIRQEVGRQKDIYQRCRQKQFWAE